MPAEQVPAIADAARQAVAPIQRFGDGSAGFSGLPVSTTHIISGGVAGTMAGSGAGVQRPVVWQIVIAWVLTVPATIALAGAFSGCSAVPDHISQRAALA
jgi:hypothetical protein